MDLESQKLDNEIPIIKDYKRWAEEYEKPLAILENDLRLVSQHGLKIYVAIDFCDLFEHCFPASEIFRGDRSLGEKLRREQYLKRELARCGLLYFMNQIYAKPLILLPPYLAESLDFFSIMPRRLNWIYDKNNKDLIRDYLSKIFEEFKEVDLKSLDKRNLYNILDKINKIAPDLAFVLSPSFMSGIDGFKNLLKEHLTPCPKDIENYMDIIYMTREMDSVHINEIVDILRPKHIIQNRRDSRAIKYIEEFNKKFGNEKALILLSSSNHFKLFRELIKCNEPIAIESKTYPPIFCEKDIFGSKCHLIRSTRPFYVALIEICNLLGKGNVEAKDFDINDIKIDDLCRMVASDLITIRNFISFTENSLVNICGAAGWDARYDTLTKFVELKEYFDRRERIDIVVLLKKLYPLVDNLEHLNEYADRELVSSLEQIRQIVNSKDFGNSLCQKIYEIEWEIKFELWYNALLKDLPIDKYGPGIFIGIIDKDSREVFEFIDRLNEILKKKELSLPENVEKFQINDKLWVVFDKYSENNLLYFIEKKDSLCAIFLLDLDLVYSELIYIYAKIKQYEKIKNKNLDPEILKKYPLFEVIDTHLKPICGNIRYKNKSEIEDYYKKLFES